MNSKKRNMKLSTKLTLLIGLVSIVGLAATFLAANTVVRSAIHGSIIQSTTLALENYARIIDNWFHEHQVVVDSMALAVEHLGEDAALEITRVFVEGSETMVIAFVGFGDDNRLISYQLPQNWTAPYGFYVNLQPWYIPLHTVPTSHISEPHVSDMYPYNLVVSVSSRMPSLQAVLSTDIVIEEISRLVESFELEYGGYMFLVTSSGLVVHHPDGSIAPTASEIRNLRDFGTYSVFFDQGANAGEVASFVSSTGEYSYLISFYLPTTGWTLAMVIPTAGIIAQIWTFLFMALVTFALVLLIKDTSVSFMVARLIRKSVSGKIEVFNKKTEALAKGVSEPDPNYTDTSYGLDKIDTEFKKVIDDVMRVKHDVLAMYSQHEVGNYKTYIDLSGHNGIYKEIVGKVNDFVMALIGNRTNIIGYFQEIADGNFEAKRKNTFVGDEAYINDVLDSVKNTIADIATSAYELAKNVSKGDLTASIETGKFSGSWKKLAERLNELVMAVNIPISEIKENVAIMANGDFSQLEADYPGVFGDLLESCNKTNRVAQAYMDELSHVLTKMAKGDLDIALQLVYVGSYAPIGQAIKTILESLNQTMADISEAAAQVATGSSQIAEGSLILAEGVVKQNDTIESLKNSIEHIHSKAIEASSSAVHASGSIKNTKEVVYQGGENVKNMAFTMNKIKESSENIEKINKAITEIAFQTNMLALNASVEAARAGEHGRGFSVVADEVRSLAGRSQKSAGETTEIVQEDLTQVANGQKITNEVVKSFETIVGNVEEIAKSLSGITKLSNDQLSSISEVNHSVADITTIVSDASIAAQESASAAEELSSTADMLKEKVSFFKLRGQ